MALGEVELMSTSSTLAEMMHHVTMIALWGVIGSAGSGESAVGSVTGIRTESGGDPDPGNAADVPVPGSEKGREKDQSQEGRRTAVVAGVESERRIAGGQREETAEVGRGVETGREGAGAGIARETGREARGWMERRSARETVPLRAGSACWRKTRVKWVRAWRSVETETGTERGTGTAGAATGTETGAGETGTETGSTKGNGGRETGGSAEKSGTAPYETTWGLKMTWAMRMREENRLTWKSIVRMG